MPESTDTAPVECPGCRTMLTERLERCFRCEADLSRWWALEDAIRTAAAEPENLGGAFLIRRNKRFRWTALLAAGVLGCVLGLGLTWIGWQQPHPIPPEARTSDLVESPSPGVQDASTLPHHVSLEGPVVFYRVQPGDSLWRIAAALTGNGSAWTSLFPEHVGREKELRIGASLLVHLSRQGGDRSEQPKASESK